MSDSRAHVRIARDDLQRSIAADARADELLVATVGDAQGVRRGERLAEELLEPPELQRAGEDAARSVRELDRDGEDDRLRRERPARDDDGSDGGISRERALEVVAVGDAHRPWRRREAGDVQAVRARQAEHEPVRIGLQHRREDRVDRPDPRLTDGRHLRQRQERREVPLDVAIGDIARGACMGEVCRAGVRAHALGVLRHDERDDEGERYEGEQHHSDDAQLLAACGRPPAGRIHTGEIT